MHPSALHAKTTTNTPKWFVYVPKPQPMRPSALHAKTTTTDVPGSKNIVPSSKRRGWGLTKRQGKGGEGEGIGVYMVEGDSRMS